MSSRNRIESVAHQTVQKSGLKNLSFRTLGAEVGVKSSSVHYHFPEKSDLGGALIQRYRQSLATTLAEIDDASPNAYDAIKLFSKLFTQECSEGKICFAGMLAAEVEFLNESNREGLQAIFNMYHTWLLDQLNQAGDELKIDLPTPTVAHLLLASLEGALLIDRAHPTNDRLSSVNILIDSWFGKIN